MTLTSIVERLAVEPYGSIGIRTPQPPICKESVITNCGQFQFQFPSSTWDINKKRLLDPPGLWAGRGYMYITCHACDTGSWLLLNHLVNMQSLLQWARDVENKPASFNFSKVYSLKYFLRRGEHGSPDQKKPLTDLELKMQV